MTVERVVTLVLVDPSRTLVGVLPPYAAELPWWQEAGDVVRLARELHGAEVVVLRLLRAELAASPGGAVTYLAEVDAATAARLDGALAAVPADIRDQALGLDPRRAAYAEVGGPAESLRWAAEQLGGLAVTEQQRTWNLSSLWRLTAVDGRVAWLKQVPEFFAHESTVLRWLGERLPQLAPPLLAVGRHGRQLLAEVPGDDLYDADVATRIQILHRAHEVQLASLHDLDTLVAEGLPERRGPAMAAWIRAVLASHVGDHPARALLERLDTLIAEVESCGFPDTLVHGDAHGGNVRSDGERLVFLDWGDSFAGHPAFDAITLTRACDPTTQATVLAAWCDLWRRSAPGCDPERALALLHPIASLRSAAVYAEFCHLIESSEVPYHRDDVPAWLDRAVPPAPGRWSAT